MDGTAKMAPRFIEQTKLRGGMAVDGQPDYDNFFLRGSGALGQYGENVCHGGAPYVSIIITELGEKSIVFLKISQKAKELNRDFGWNRGR